MTNQQDGWEDVNPDDWGGTAAGGGFDSWDTDDVDAAEIGSGDPKVDKVGWYHFEVSATARPLPHAKDDMSKLRTPDILLACKVLKGVKDQSPEGSVYFHNLILAGKGGGQIESYDKTKTLNFLVGVGVLKKVDGRVIDPETRSTRINTQTLEARLNNLQFIGKLELNRGGPRQDGSGNYPDRIELSWGRGAFQLDDPKVKDVPKCEESLKKAAKLHAANTANGSPAGQQPSSAQTGSPPHATAAANPLAAMDL